MPLFQSDIPALYHPAPVTAGELTSLTDEEARHARALRLRVGSPVLLLDGNGLKTSAEIHSIEKRLITVRPHTTHLEQPHPGMYIALAVGILADKSRMEWCVEKGVELGVRELFPLKTARTEGFFHESRAERIAVAALKQSQQPYLPNIHAPHNLHGITAIFPMYDAVYLCHEHASAAESLAAIHASGAPNAGRVLLLVGPEGGFTEEETTLAREQGAQVVSLGGMRLRSETAAIVALALLATGG